MDTYIKPLDTSEIRIRLHPFFCSRCGRHTKKLKVYNFGKEWLCSFCLERAKDQIFTDKYYGESEPKKAVCPVCKKTFEREKCSKGLRIYCDEDCKNKAYNDRHKEKLKPNIE
jgi:hypothetical protein